MLTLGEYTTVQARIQTYAEAIGWTIVSPEKSKQRRGFDTDSPPAVSSKNRSLFFGNLLNVKVRELNLLYVEAEGAQLRQLRRFHTNIYGNGEVVDYVRNQGKFFGHKDTRERQQL